MYSFVYREKGKYTDASRRCSSCGKHISVERGYNLLPGDIVSSSFQDEIKEFVE